jgi:hypothetical protein
MPTLARSHIFSSIPKQGPALSEAIMDAIVWFQKRSGANALPLESFRMCHHCFSRINILICRGTTVEKLEEAIGKGVLVVCEFQEAYHRYQLDYAEYWAHLLHPILLPKKNRHHLLIK